VVEHALASDRPPYFSGLTVRYDPARPPGHRVVDLHLTSGRSIRDGASYTLALSDFLATGGDGLTMLIGQRSQDSGQFDIDALIGWLRRQHQPVQVPSNGRFIRVSKHERIEPRLR
jgi:5'-nucleotidase